MTTLFRCIIFLYMLLLEFMVISAWVLANFWVRHWLGVPLIMVPDTPYPHIERYATPTPQCAASL
jgi:hypothetical protein